MPDRRFIQCDVFSPTPLQGNGLAVVVDAAGMTSADMQRFAAWTNLAETAFLLPPEDPQADYTVRIFTPKREMRFAGHPTLGSCAAWLHAGGVPREPGLVRQACGVGLVEIDVSQPEILAFQAPPTVVQPMDPQLFQAIVERLEIPREQILHTAQLDNGPVWQAFHLASAEAVLALDGNRVRYPEFLGIGLIGPHPPGAAADYEVRMLAPTSGMLEDPITGSLNAALAHWLQGEKVLPPTYVVAQGRSIQRNGRVFVRSVADGTVFIGGHTHILIEGLLTL